MNSQNYVWWLGRGIMTASVCWLAATPVQAKDYSQWRGPQRNGCSQETGLLKQWPKEGPKLVWEIKDLGTGYSTPAVVGGTLYLLSSQGLDNESVRALSAKDGKQIWSTRLGKVGNPDQNPHFPAARSTPTVDGAQLYALSSDGDLACLEAADGKVTWHKNLRSDFGGKPGTWAYAESPLIDGDVLVCTPGGGQATIVALNKNTGAVVWKCATPEGDDAAYSSVIAMEAGGVKQYVQLLGKGLVGVDAKTGQLLWRYARLVSKYGANIPTPVADQSSVYGAAAGTGGGRVTLKASGGKFSADEAYFSPKLPTSIGGVIKLGDYLYGTSQALQCLDFATGQAKWEDRSLGPASLCFAEGRLYMHGENGEVALVEATSAGYHELGRFSPPDQPKRINQMEKAWTYPVVADGRLYIRDANMLWCYNVKQ
jgi:outer membrane protein assembly factor BamB